MCIMSSIGILYSTGHTVKYCFKDFSIICQILSAKDQESELVVFIHSPTSELHVWSHHLGDNRQTSPNIAQWSLCSEKKHTKIFSPTGAVCRKITKAVAVCFIFFRPLTGKLVQQSVNRVTNKRHLFKETGRGECEK